MNEQINDTKAVCADLGSATLNRDPTSKRDDPMTLFLSEESLSRHREYHRRLRVKYSILEKSEMLLNSTDIHKIPWQKIDKDLQAEAFALLSEYTLHTAFFASFAEKKTDRLPAVIDGVGSASQLLNKLFRLGKNDNDGGFLVILRGKHSIAPARIFPPYRELCFATPLLAVDLYEHAYFSDYGFERERYLYAALSHLDLNLLR